MKNAILIVALLAAGTTTAFANDATIAQVAAMANTPATNVGFAIAHYNGSGAFAFSIAGGTDDTTIKVGVGLGIPDGDMIISIGGGWNFK